MDHARNFPLQELRAVRGKNLAISATMPPLTGWCLLAGGCWLLPVSCWLLTV
jgi:hypothetical protein